MLNLVKSLFPLIIFTVFCAFVAFAFLIGTALVHALAAIGLGAISYLVPPICVLVAIFCCSWVVRYLFRKTLNMDERK